MMMTQKVHGRVGLRLWTRSITYIANEIQRVWMEVANARGASLDYLLSRSETIKNGLVAWLTTRSLNRATLEFYTSERDSEAAERWDMAFTYDTTGQRDSEDYQTHLDRITSLAREVKALPPGTCYRVVVDLAPEAVAVPGWSNTALRNVSHLQRYDLGDAIESTRIGVQMEYHGRF